MPKHRAVIEAVEPRKLFAVTVTANHLRSIVITGTEGDDDIVIQNYLGTPSDPLAPGSKPRLQVSDHGTILFTFPCKSVRGLYVELNGGDDKLTVYNIRGTVHAAFNNSQIFGGNGDDLIDFRARKSQTIIFGGRGNDTLLGGDGADKLVGNQDNDVLDGRYGQDVIQGMEDDDSIFVTPRNDGGDAYSGGLGNDTIDYSARNHGVAIGSAMVFSNGSHSTKPIHDYLLIDGRVSSRERTRLTYDGQGNVISGGKLVKAYLTPDTAKLEGCGGRENDYLAGDIEIMIGTESGDIIFGTRDGNTLEGRGGDDFLVGGAGIDAIYGGDGNDLILSADNRDGFPGIRYGDRVVGGRGHDTARTDGRDFVARVETEDELEFLTS